MQNNNLKYFFLLNIIFSFSIFSNFIQDLPAPYCDLKEVLPFNGHGWYYNAVWIE